MSGGCGVMWCVLSCVVLYCVGNKWRECVVMCLLCGLSVWVCLSVWVRVSVCVSVCLLLFATTPHNPTHQSVTNTNKS